MEGVVYAPEGRYYLEPLRNYLPSASAGELVFYRHADIKTGEAMKCGVSLPQRLQRGVDRVTAQVGAASQFKYEFDVATAADYEFVQAMGGSENANREIRGILNQVEGVFQSELLLQLRITFQHAWDMQDDPYMATNNADLLEEFTVYWNGNFAAEQTYDLAHLWSGKVLEGGIGGVAVSGAVCIARRFSYSMSTIQNRTPEKYVIPAHEIGHNFGANHPHEVNPSVEGCTNTLMSVVTSGGGSERQLTFCQYSRREIADYVSGNYRCLTPRPISIQQPRGLSATATSESRINLAWQDGSTNETGFLVQRRQEGSGNWVAAGTTTADAETCSDGELYSSATYIYRVQAFNDMESSAFSNEAAATTRTTRKTNSGWIIDTIAGGRNNEGDSGPAVTARLNVPDDVALDRAGLAFPGLGPEGLLTGPAFITGLRQNRQDRSNLAVQNAAGVGDGRLTLRVTVYSGDPEAPGSLVLPDLQLPPGGFHQYNRILTEAGFDNGYVKVERVEGAAPYYAYGVVNDNFNSDGSFVFPVREDSLVGSRGQTLPVIIETKDFTSELTVTNFSPAPKTVDFRFVAEAVETHDDTAVFSLELEAGEQRILPGVVDWMREQEVPGIGAADDAFVGALFATVAEGDMNGIVMGARTGSPDTRGGQYSLFYNGVPYGSATNESAWIYGLQQNEENRSNLALVNTGELDGSDSTFEIDIYDGEGDSEPRTRSVTLPPRRWHQLNGILGDRRQGYVEVRKVAGNNPFITFGVINDGGMRGQRSGDGAFLPSQE